VPTRDRRFPLPGIADLAARQAGVVARPQLIGLGMTDGQIQTQLSAGRWQRAQPLLAGVYVTHTGPLDYLARWSASGPTSLCGDTRRANRR
jgi:hypothetical protein